MTIQQFEQNLRALRQQQMAEAREAARRERDAATMGMMASVLGTLATSSAVAAVMVRDPNEAAAQMASSNRYLVASSLAFLGPDAVLKFLSDTK